MARNSFLKIAVGLLICITGFYFLYVSPRYSVPILTYHSFDSSKGLLSVTPENFEKQMHFLKYHGYKVITLNELVEGKKIHRKFAHNTVVITIDDGYENNFTYAYPVLRKYGFPATIFLITNFIGVHPEFLNWDEVKEMSKNNISFGGHTKNHVYLPSVKKEVVLRDEITGSKKAIEEHIGIPVDYFCYPLGGFTEEAKRIVKESGYKGAVATNRGFDLLNRKDMYELNRVSVRNSEPDSLFAQIKFRAKLSGYYYLFKKGKAGN